MTFDNIHNDTHCQCLDNTAENLVEVFARKIKKSEPSDGDFSSHWERGILGNSAECKEICLRKSLSINKYDASTESQIIEKYKTTFNISPAMKAYYCKFRFKLDAGLIKSTPNNNDKSHCSFFKCDAFTIDRIDVVDIQRL